MSYEYYLRFESEVDAEIFKSKMASSCHSVKSSDDEVCLKSENGGSWRYDYRILQENKTLFYLEIAMPRKIIDEFFVSTLDGMRVLCTEADGGEVISTHDLFFRA